MSIKGWVQPYFASLLTSQSLLDRRRRRAERRRQRNRRPHTVTWYHRAHDPYSHLLSQVLPGFLEKYDVDLVCKTVAEPPADFVPFPDLLAVYSLRDCCEIAPYFGLNISKQAPRTEATATANAMLVEVESGGPGEYLDKAAEVGTALWKGEVSPTAQHANERLAINWEELHRRGHYYSGMLHYGGEWYWGIDRLPLLEERLAQLGVGKGSSLSRQSVESTPLDIQSFEVFLSIRSPYSYLAVDRAFEFGRRHNLDLILKPMLPMVMRGLPVPFKKRMFILQDAKREAVRNNIPFGHVCDPLGPGVERVLAVLAQAQREDKTEKFLSSAMHGIWAEGVEVSSNRGLRRVVERAGIDWAKARAALEDESWRQEVEKNRQELQELGLWGVPSFRLGDLVTWGQDRLWLLEEKVGLQTTTKAD